MVGLGASSASARAAAYNCAGGAGSSTRGLLVRPAALGRALGPHGARVSRTLRVRHPALELRYRASPEFSYHFTTLAVENQHRRHAAHLTETGALLQRRKIRERDWIRQFERALEGVRQRSVVRRLEHDGAGVDARMMTE